MTPSWFAQADRRSLFTSRVPAKVQGIHNAAAHLATVHIWTVICAGYHELHQTHI